MGNNDRYEGNDFRGGGGNGESNFSDLNTNIVNLNDVAVNIPFSNFQNHANVNRSSNVSNHSQPLSRTRSPPPAASRLETPTSTLNGSMHSVSAHMTFANASLQTPVSSSPVLTPSILQTNQQEHQNNSVALSDLPPPKLLNSFQQPYNSDNSNEVNYVVDIPDANFYTDNNNNDGGNSNIILNVDPSVQSSPTGSQFGSM